MRTRTASLVVLLAAAGSAVAAGPSLVSIGALTPAAGGTVESKINAMSPDGQWVVGYSNGQNIAGTATITQSVIWSATSGLVQLPNPADVASHAKGVVEFNNGDVGVAAYYYDVGTGSTRMHHYVVPPSNLQGGTWVLSPGANLNVGSYNAARNYDNGTGTGWSIAGQRGTGARAVISLPTAGAFADSGALTGYARMYHVTSRVPTGTDRGYAAGYERNTTTNLRRAIFGIGGATQTVIPGSAGYQSEVMGMTPLTTEIAGSGVLVGYDQDNTADHFAHAYYYIQGAGAMVLMNELPGDNQSRAIDVRVIGGSRLIGGFSSDGTTEKAVLWGNSGQPTLLSGLLASLGVDVSAWSSLSRVTSLSDDGQTVAGIGIWAEDGSTRGFVATIPEPATLMLLGLLGFSLLARRRR